MVFRALHTCFGNWLVRAAVAPMTLALVLLADPEIASAKTKPMKKEEPATKSYVMPYAIVAMCVGLGLAVLLRPGKRLDEPRRPDRQE